VTDREWNNCADPQAMMHWLDAQGYHDALWAFAAAGCRRLWDDLPGPEFRKVVVLAEQIGCGLATWAMIDDALLAAAGALERLERKCRAAGVEQWNRRLVAADAVFVFGFQDALAAAGSISRHFLEVLTDPASERLAQAELLRRLAPDPSRPARTVAEPGAPDAAGM
jgi:hypothetical protein